MLFIPGESLSAGIVVGAIIVLSALVIISRIRERPLEGRLIRPESGKSKPTVSGKVMSLDAPELRTLQVEKTEAIVFGKYAFLGFDAPGAPGDASQAFGREHSSEIASATTEGDGAALPEIREAIRLDRNDFFLLTSLEIVAHERPTARRIPEAPPFRRPNRMPSLLGELSAATLLEIPKVNPATSQCDPWSASRIETSPVGRRDLIRAECREPLALKTDNVAALGPGKSEFPAPEAERQWLIGISQITVVWPVRVEKARSWL